MKGQGSVVVVSIVLIVAFSAILALYVSAMNSLVEVANEVKSVNERYLMAQRERVSISVTSAYLASSYGFTLYDVTLQIANTGSVTTGISKVIVSCLNSRGYVKASVPLSIKPIYLQPGQEVSYKFTGTIPLRCYGVTLTFVTVYGNSLTVVIP